MRTNKFTQGVPRALIVVALVLHVSCSSAPAFEGDNSGGFPFAPPVSVQAFDRGEVLEIVLLNKSEKRSVPLNYVRDTFVVTTKDGKEFSLGKGSVEDYPQGPFEPKSPRHFRLLLPKDLQGHIQDLAAIACNFDGEETVLLRPKSAGESVPPESWSGSGGRVYVHGYYRKDGTYVHPVHAQQVAAPFRAGAGSSVCR